VGGTDLVGNHCSRWRKNALGARNRRDGIRHGGGVAFQDRVVWEGEVTDKRMVQLNKEEGRQL
jgi:hypothetical protein